MPVQTTDVFLINRGGVSYQVTAADIASLVQDTDLMLVNRNGTSYKLTGANFKASSFQDTDLFLVNRAGLSYQESGANVRSLIAVQRIWGWDAASDTYTTVPVADLNIDVQSRMRRCLVSDAGVVEMYLDANNSARRSGDWLRIVETATLDTPYTGTFGTAETPNTLLRAGVPAWAAGTHRRGDRRFRNGSVWECVAANTTATPAAGTITATLNGTSQVMVEIPRFSVRHQTSPSGAFNRHSFSIALGTVTTDGYEVHPAFVRLDGSMRDFIYVGAYLGTGTNGNGSLSGVNNTVSISRDAARTACAGRGTGWHAYGFWTHNAIQWLYLTEYGDMISRRALGLGSRPTATVSIKTTVATGASNSRGNRCGNVTSTPPVDTDYMSYRGLENITGCRSAMHRDGMNVDNSDPAGLRVYLCAHPENFLSGTATNHTDFGLLPQSTTTAQIRDIGSGIALLPSAVDATTTPEQFVGDNLVTNATGTGWSGATVRTQNNTTSSLLVGIFGTNATIDSTISYNNVGTRLCYSP